MVRLYCVADECGPHTKGRLYTVGIAILTDLDKARTRLSIIESESGKGARKWTGSHDTHEAYMKLILREPLLQGKLYYGEYRNTIEYNALTTFTIVAALTVHPPEEGKPHIMIDGLQTGRRQGLPAEFRRYGVHPDKVEAINSENATLGRLVDALAGFTLDAADGAPIMKRMLTEASDRGVIRRVQK